MTARGRRPAFFEDKAIDSIVTMIIELTAELWVVKDRVNALETLLEEHAPGLQDKLEQWQPDDSQAGKLEAQRAELLRTVLRTLDANFTTRAEIQRERDAEIAENVADGGDE